MTNEYLLTGLGVAGLAAWTSTIKAPGRRCRLLLDWVVDEIASQLQAEQTRGGPLWAKAGCLVGWI